MKKLMIFMLLTLLAVPVLAQNSIRDSILTIISAADTANTTFQPPLSYTIPTVITSNMRFSTDTSRPLWITKKGTLPRQSYTKITCETRGQYDTVFVEKIVYTGAGTTLDSSWGKCVLYNIDLSAPQTRDTLMYVNNITSGGNVRAQSYVIDSFLGEKIRICRKSPKKGNHKVYIYVDSEI